MFGKLQKWENAHDSQMGVDKINANTLPTSTEGELA